MLLPAQLWLRTALSSHHAWAEPARAGIEFLPHHPFLPGLPTRLLTGKKGICARWAAARELHGASGTAGALAEQLLARSKMWEPLQPYPSFATAAPRPGLASHTDLCNSPPSRPAPLAAHPLAAAMASGGDLDGEQVVPDGEDEGPDVKAVQAHYLRSPSPSR